MTVLTADRATAQRANSEFSYPVAAAARLFAGALVCINASGFAVRGAASTTLRAVGAAIEPADNAAGANGAITCKVRRGLWRFENSAAGDLITLADVGAQCFIVDDSQVARTNGSSTRSVAGVVRDVDTLGVWVEI
jgi:hypothetical protein